MINSSCTRSTFRFSEGPYNIFQPYLLPQILAQLKIKMVYANYSTETTFLTHALISLLLKYNVEYAV